MADVASLASGFSLLGAIQLHTPPPLLNDLFLELHLCSCFTSLRSQDGSLLSDYQSPQLDDCFHAAVHDYSKEPSQHYPGVISGTQGEPKSGWPDQDSIPGSSECESIRLDCSTPAEVNQVRFSAGLPLDFRVRESSAGGRRARRRIKMRYQLASSVFDRRQIRSPAGQGRVSTAILRKKCCIWAGHYPVRKLPAGAAQHNFVTNNTIEINEFSFDLVLDHDASVNWHERRVEEIWAALNIRVLRAVSTHQRRNEKVREKPEIPEKTRRPASSSGAIPTCENPERIGRGLKPVRLGGRRAV
ncbi:hypothetical protein PR048_030540 [Dryococelus australis]|uniref:Uncharacterized protein n=1 Tax=Dryococelus australis TaxID=614101 RepID=A0ABQ9GD35_9NEOP|nr:hypothetical protein PR048_030540 [Dryococelus australis]